MTGASSWATSPTYGSVLLGPAQSDVYRYVVGMTREGARPYLTLGRIASAIGRPVSSVHSALGRLRALGLIGFVARMGRTGGFRLWRPRRSSTARPMDRGRHSRTVARIMRRWRAMTAHSASVPDDDRPVPGQRPLPLEPVAGSPSPAAGEFGAALRRYGFRPWWDRVEERTDDDDRVPRPDHGTP